MSEGSRGKHRLNLRGAFMYAPPSDDKYRDNYDRIFGKNSKENSEEQQDAKGKPFKPGQSGNPKGRKPKDHEQKAVEELNHIAIQQLLNTFMHLPEPELKKIMKDPKLPIIHKAFIQCLIKAGQGQLPHLDLVMDRTVGKVPEGKRDISFSFQGLPRERVIELGKQAVQYLEAAEEAKK